MTLLYPALDLPDFYSAVPSPGVTIYQGSTNNSFEPLQSFVGTFTAINIAFKFTLGPWLLTINWWDLTRGILVSQEEYQGYGACTVLDTLPVVSPWMDFNVQLTSATPPAEALTYYVSSSMQSQHKSNLHINGGVVLVEEGQTAAAMSTTTILGSYLTPGWYQFSCYTPDNLTGQLQFVMLDQGNTPYPLFRATDPAAFFSAAGQLIVGNYQPAFQIVNDGGSPITYNACLIGPQ